MEDDIRSKSFPENYSSDAVRVLDAMSFTKGKSVGLLGSMSLRSQQYAGDYDAFEIVNLKEKSNEDALRSLADEFKTIVKNLLAMKDTYVGDVKAGSVEEWRVLPRSAKVKDGKLIGMDVIASRKKLDELAKAKVISPNEKKYGESLLSGEMTPIRFLLAKQHLKFHIVRWTISDILKGDRRLRDGRTYTLEDAFSSPAITKLDVISYVQNNRYTDFSMIYYFRNNETVLNPDEYDFVDGIKENILYYEKVGNPFKVLKRKFALAKFTKDASMITKLTPILNSDLGRIYHVLGDIGTLIRLLEDEQPDRETVRVQIDQFVNRLANVYQLKDYLKEEHTILGEIASALKDTNRKTLVPKLRTLEDQLERILREGTEKADELTGGALDIRHLFPLNERGIQKSGKMGLKNYDYLYALEELVPTLGALAHFYSYRDPATALGFRTLKDSIYEQTKYWEGHKGPIPRPPEETSHEEAQTFLAKSILGTNEKNAFPQFNPNLRYETEVLPLVEKAMRRDNPFKIVPKTGKYGYKAPPETVKQAVFALQDRPGILLDVTV